MAAAAGAGGAGGGAGAGEEEAAERVWNERDVEVARRDAEQRPDDQERVWQPGGARQEQHQGRQEQVQDSPAHPPLRLQVHPPFDFPFSPPPRFSVILTLHLHLHLHLNCSQDWLQLRVALQLAEVPAPRPALPAHLPRQALLPPHGRQGGAGRDRERRGLPGPWLLHPDQGSHGGRPEGGTEGLPGGRV